MRIGKIKVNHYINYAVIGLLTLVLSIITMVGGRLDNSLLFLMEKMAISIILAVSLSMVVGFLGELSLGHAGFMCVGAFTGAFFSKCMNGAMPDGLRFFLAIVLGAAMAGIAGFLIGVPVLRLKGDYLAIVTLAFGEIIKNLVNAFYVGRDSRGFHFSMKDTLSLGLEDGGEVIIKGAQGITKTPQDASFTIGVILLLIALVIVLNFINSRSGRAVMSIRDNRIAAESVGINVTKYKLMAFMISAALAGTAGVLYAHNLTTLTALPKNFGYNQSIMILIYVVLGGIGNIRGSVIGAVVLTLLPEMIRSLGNYRMLVYAVILIVMMLFSWSPKAREFRERYSPKRLLAARKNEKGEK